MRSRHRKIKTSLVSNHYVRREKSYKSSFDATAQNESMAEQMKSLNQSMLLSHFTQVLWVLKKCNIIYQVPQKYYKENDYMTQHLHI